MMILLSAAIAHCSCCGPRHDLGRRHAGHDAVVAGGDKGDRAAARAIGMTEMGMIIGNPLHGA